MRKTVKMMLAVLLLAAMVIPMCSCQKVEAFFKDLDVGGALQEGLDKTGLENDNEGKNRESRISGALAKAKDSQKAYNINRSLNGKEEQPEGTKYVVEANGYYVEFTIENGNLEDTNPEEIPTEDPYKDDDDYKRVKGSEVAEVRDDVRIYLPKGEN